MPLKHDEVKLYSELFRSLEEREPILSAWRYHCDSPKLSLKKKIITTLADLKKKGASYLSTLQSPKPGQVVVLLLRDSPATSGMLLPIMRSLCQIQAPAFLILNGNTKHYLQHGLHSGYATVNQLLCSVLKRNEVKKIEHMAKGYQNELVKVSNSKRFENAADWIAMGLKAKEVSRIYFGALNFILTDTDLGAFDKGILLGTSKQSCSAILQHGFFDEKNFPIHSKKHIDWGPYFTKQAELYGHPANRSVSLGSPRFDRLEAIKQYPRNAEVLSKFDMLKKPVVMAISNTHAYGIFREHLDSYVESIEELLDSDITLLVRLHPAETGTSFYHDRLGTEKCRKIIFISAKEDMYEIMNKCDVVYHTLSSAAMEGMLLGKPVLWEEAPEKRAYMEPPLLGGGIFVNSGNIVDAVKSVGPEGAERKKVLDSQEEFLSISVVNRGHAADAIADYMLEKTSKEDP